MASRRSARPCRNGRPRSGRTVGAASALERLSRDALVGGRPVSSLLSRSSARRVPCAMKILSTHFAGAPATPPPSPKRVMVPLLVLAPVRLDQSG